MKRFFVKVKEFFDKLERGKDKQKILARKRLAAGIGLIVLLLTQGTALVGGIAIDGGVLFFALVILIGFVIVGVVWITLMLLP